MLSTRHHQLVIKSFKDIKKKNMLNFANCCAPLAHHLLYTLFSFNKLHQLYFHFEI